MGNMAQEEESVKATPLAAMAEAFEELSKLVKTCPSYHLRLITFCDACSLVSVLFGCLGIAFKFAELEYVSKVLGLRLLNDTWMMNNVVLLPLHQLERSFNSEIRDLLEASKTYDTLEDIIDRDIENNTVRSAGSHSRNLRRVRQGLDLIRALFEQFLLSDDFSLREAASAAYSQVCAPYHTWAVRTAVSAGMYALPVREQLLVRLNENGQSAEKQMRRYINASLPVIAYIDELYMARNISLDW
ncbi:ACD11-like protein [Vitis vinifera]|uniref:ACD11-like protein n=1 Tax=Vitis vinifera TaxID=29760 RepID=A0A438FYJ0_VITVI|nr:ACD11-like protein [Vitis vinifera]